MIAKQKMVKNVFSHSIMMEQHILHVHQLTMMDIHGVLMKLIVTEISLVKGKARVKQNGKIVMLPALNYQVLGSSASRNSFFVEE